MLANLHPGQCIDHIVFDLNGKPAHVQSEIVNIEIHCNEGRGHTIRGALPWQMLTFKYVVLIVANSIENYRISLQVLP